MAGLHFTVMASELSLVIYLRGELDLDSTDQLFFVTRAVLDDSDACTLELDLADLTFIDMAGLRALRTVHEDARRRGCDLRVRSMSARMLRMVSLSRIDDILPGASRTQKTAARGRKLNR